MNRQSRLATSWGRIAPELGRLVESRLPPLAAGGAGSREALARVLACSWMRVVHSSLSAGEVGAVCEEAGRGLGEPYDALLALIAEQKRDATGLFRELADLATSRVVAAGQAAPTALDVVNRVHEFLLWLEAPGERRRRGAYYTPQAAARVLFELGQERFSTMTGDGLGIWSPQARVLDFAAGTGVFFAAGMEMAAKEARFENWLSVEIDAEAAAIGRFCLEIRRRELGLGSCPRLEVADALGSFEIGERVRRPFNFIIGNPPYSAFGGEGAEWMEGLLRGRDPIDGSPRASYHSGEKQTKAAHRRHALGDDYVRFLRLAHWQIERAGFGVIALVLNHGILENGSFRDLRKTLAEGFDEVLLLDLHGNAKRRELTPQGTRDESVFNIEQGTMIAVLAKWPDARGKKTQIGHVYGLREEKIFNLVQREWEKELVEATPAAPQFFFHAKRRSESRQLKAYLAAPSLAEAMPVHSTAMVTARDQVVVDMSRERLRKRLEMLCDVENVSDEAVREALFAGRGDSKQATGDTRSWKLGRARERLAAGGVDAIPIVGFWYRPWDWRWLAYSKHLIDWRREKFMPLLLSGDNVAIVTRRQSPPGAKWNYVWTTNSVVLDGILRSDNRGTEFVFPLYGSGMAANFERRFAEEIREKLGIDESSLFYSIAAVLHSGAYQRAFGEELCRDFPRVLLPAEREVAEKLAAVGRRIVGLETMRFEYDYEHEHEKDREKEYEGEGMLVAAGYPKFCGGVLAINEKDGWRNVPEEIWGLRAGAHQMALRWLKQRRGMRLMEEDLRHVRRMLGAAGELVKIGEELEAIVVEEEMVGWR